MSKVRVIGDWGGSRLRLWRLADGAVAERREGPGILACGDPARALADAMAGWQAESIILCGMAGARDGLHETAYLACPATQRQWSASAARLALDGIALKIAAGLSCRNAGNRPDVMRGEETQIFGAIALHPTLATGSHGVFLPGTHSKWVRLEEGRIAGFRTVMTGELYALLGKSSLALMGGVEGDEDAGFADGLARAGEGGSLSSSLFEARAAQLIDGKPSGWARGFVSGLLIGAEIAAMAPCGLLHMICDPAQASRYGDALAQHGTDALNWDAEECAIAGLGLLDDD